LDVGTQQRIDERNLLVNKPALTDEEELRLAELNSELSQLGFLFDSREPLYKDFLKSWHDLRYAERPPMSPEQSQARREAMKVVLRQLMNKEGAR
jgi:hypothetical protein